MEIKKEDIVNAYVNGDESARNLLRTQFPNINFEKGLGASIPVTERIKTFEDAIDELGKDHPLVQQWKAFAGLSGNDVDEYNADLCAYYKLRIITAALNEGWQPKFTEDERRWYPWFYLYTEDELAEKDDKWKQSHTMIATDDYDTKYAGFVYAHSGDAPSATYSSVGSRLCYKSEALADYSSRKFADLWADFNLIRKWYTAMTQKEKLKEATEKYLEEEGYKPYIEKAFQDGAQWAQEEFIKSQWHDASEEPNAKLDAWLIMQTGKDLYETVKYAGYNKDGGQTWQRQAEKGYIIRWAYLDDILPKKGGEG